MVKLILVGSLVLILAAGGFWWWQQPQGLPTPNPDLGLEEVPVIGGLVSTVLGIEAEEVGQTASQSVSDIKDNIYDQAQTTLNTVFDKPTAGSSQVSSTGSPVSIQVLGAQAVSPGLATSLTLDLSLGSNLKYNLQRNTKYFLNFQNLTSGQCLYINGVKYQLNSDQVLVVEFANAGNFVIKSSQCEVKEQDIGELVVQ